MARCKNCPALDDPEFTAVGDEHVMFGDGCPDEIYDFYGGDCINNKDPPPPNEHSWLRMMPGEG